MMAVTATTMMAVTAMKVMSVTAMMVMSVTAMTVITMTAMTVMAVTAITSMTVNAMTVMEVTAMTVTAMTVIAVTDMIVFQIGAGLYAVGRPVQKRNDEDGQIGTIQSLPLERGALFNRFFGEPAHGPPHVAGGASGPIGGCRDESRTDNPDLDLRHVFDRTLN